MHSAVVATSVVIVLRLMFSSLDVDAHPLRDWIAAFLSLVRRGLFALFGVPIVISDRLIDADDRVNTNSHAAFVALEQQALRAPFTCNSYA
jgi:hypothetical protein